MVILLASSRFIKMSASCKKQDYPKASDMTHYGGILSYIAGIFLIVAFCGPYWIQAYDDASNPFMNVGLWEYCFKEFPCPYSSFPRDLYGCHYVYSETLDEIRHYLLPDWLRYTQATVLTALFLSLFSQFVSAMTLMRWPLRLVLTHEWRLTFHCFCLNFFICMFLFAAVIAFGNECLRRQWLTYPNNNSLSWSYGSAVASLFFHVFATGVHFLDARKQYQCRHERRNLIAQMYPDPTQNGFV